MGRLRTTKNGSNSGMCSSVVNIVPASAPTSEANEQPFRDIREQDQFSTPITAPTRIKIVHIDKWLFRP